MKRLFWAVALAGVVSGASVTAQAQPAELEAREVKALTTVTVMRGTNGNPGKQPGVHPKRIDDREPSRLDRFAIIRFDSADFGDGVVAARLPMKARADDDDTFKGKHRFMVYGVRDGDEQDEKFTYKTYKPGAEGTLFRDSATMLDRRQVGVLGTFRAEPGQEVKFSSASLNAMIRSDTNGTVTLVVTRLSMGGQNSVFNNLQNEKPPRLDMRIKPAEAAAQPDAAADDAEAKATDEAGVAE